MWSKAEWDLYWKRKEADWKAEKWRKRYGTLFVIVCFTILILPIAVILVPSPDYWKEAKRLKKDDAEIVRLLDAGEYTEAAKKINTLEWTYPQAEPLGKGDEYKKTYAEKRNAYLARLRPIYEEQGAAKFAQWYTKSADIVVGKTFLFPQADEKSGELGNTEAVLFGRKGMTSLDEMYTLNAALRTASADGIDGSATEYRYFPDGSAVYAEKDGVLQGWVRKGAAFSAKQATEVADRSFSGKWSDGFTATITFGKNGTAQVKFNDGDTGNGAYIASGEDNIVFYNHRNKGIWFMLSYSDSDDSASFTRIFARKNEDGTFSLARDVRGDWVKK